MVTHIELHALHTVPPSCINRDENGSPKTAWYGGYNRARVSSQAWKRAMREHMNRHLPTALTGVRTKRIVALLADTLRTVDPALSDTDAITLAKDAALAAGLVKATTTKKKGTTEPVEEIGEETDALFFVSQAQLTRVAEHVLAAADQGSEAVRALSLKPILKTGPSADLLLFGRMVADEPNLNVDATCQVAHALSVHRVDNEFDYYTAVDDLSASTPGAHTGAAMIGNTEFNSATLYRYATVNVTELAAGLNDPDATAQTLAAFTAAFTDSMPTGKQNAFANATLPDLVVMTVRRTQPINLVGAFEDPVDAVAGSSRTATAATRLAGRAADIARVMGHAPNATHVVAMTEAAAALEGTSWAASMTTLPDLYQAAAQVGTDMFGESS